MGNKRSVARYQRLNRPQYGKGRRDSKRRRARWLWALALVIVGALAYAGWRAYSIYTAPAGNLEETAYILITPDATLEEVRKQIDTKISPRHPQLLSHLLKHKRVDKNLRPGRYAITPAMTTADVVQVLLSGEQTPVTLRLRNLRTEDDIVDYFAQRIMLPRAELVEALTNKTWLRELDMTRDEMRSLFFAQDYQVLWDTSAEALLDTLRRHHERFWTAERIAKADSIGLTTAQVASLAAIVEEESKKTDEYSRIAGLYLNRLNKGLRLQSDPTVKFALSNFDLRRILNVHLQTPSPYNTYYVGGLPPGPIRVVRTETLDHVLNAEPHSYIYMCARETFDGYHNFASDYATHLQNARAYQRALNNRGIN